ncbi:hypothetical protein PV721_27885 [Streptomyces sp. MB09-01]|uniref:hypothetical protein n=1 Tax=Streptomyces sp. MB09-01 TaxID=3028666 RepID=UPI0029AB4B9C|nr:hypothetical protein [Streptomyces sp. MB09-01]MDX3538106.1 hypothetical protein [Streptomyces sp. MB09-01]
MDQEAFSTFRRRRISDTGDVRPPDRTGPYRSTDHRPRRDRSTDDARTARPDPCRRARSGPLGHREFPAGNTRLLDVERIDVDTTWTAGFRISPEGKAQSLCPVLFGREDSSDRWKQIPTPLDDVRTRINAIGASPQGDAWLVGDADEATHTIRTAHHDDTGWKPAPAPLPEGMVSGGFLGVAAVDHEMHGRLAGPSPTVRSSPSTD